MTFLEKLKWLFSSSDKIPMINQGNNNSPDNHQTDELTEQQFVDLFSKHPIFIELREWHEYRTKVLSIANPIKRNMAKHYLTLLFESLRSAIKQIVIEHDKYLDDIIALNNLIIDTINDVKQTALQDGVPEIFLDKFTNYLYTQTKILDLTYRDLDKFEYYHQSKIARTTVRLDLEFLTIRNITSEVETVINDMNGELEAALEGSVFDA